MPKQESPKKFTKRLLLISEILGDSLTEKEKQELSTIQNKATDPNK